jgi:hypothetical protein
VPGALSLGVKQQGHEADHSHLELRLRLVELYLHSPIMSLWHNSLHGVISQKTELYSKEGRGCQVHHNYSNYSSVLKQIWQVSKISYKVSAGSETFCEFVTIH